ncbi:hypothetical protein DFH06DRAFT_1148496 [Mycena polygramma]|nr:hypothetical protein DFH06DRAFT_1351137 [Mycena polygramma]KAJ7609380.1 hypothetical protein DFH06DRAFT_1148496 [Mycena polygramma]
MSDGATKATFKLEGEQRKFVDEFLPKFRDYERTLENQSGVKGLKKNWVLNNVAPPFIKKFTPETDYRLDDVREAIKRYCYNNGIVKSGETVVEKASTKPPKATTALAEYVKQAGKQLAEDAKALTPPEHVGVQRQNLKYWGEAKTAGWAALDEKTRKEFEKRAEDSNKELAKGPPASHIRENQSKAVQQLASALTKKMGWGWGGLGDIALQLTGGFRNEDGKLKLFQLSMQPTENAPAFDVPEPKEFVAAFKRWAGEVLPQIADEADLTVLVGKEGSPALPDWNDDMSTNDVRRLLVLYGNRLHEWLTYPTPAAMDDIVFSMQMAPDGKGDEDGVWETFRPATMDTGALHELYKRIAKDQNPEEPGALVFRDPRAEVADTVDEDDIAKGVKPVGPAKAVEPSGAKSNSSDPKVPKKNVAGGSRLPDYALGAPAVPPASPAPATPSPVGDDEGGGDGGQQNADEKGAGDKGKKKKVKKGKTGSTAGDDEGTGNGGQRKADEGSGSEKDKDQRGAAKAVPPPSPAPSALSSLSSIGDDEGGGNTGKRKADEEGEGGEKKKQKKAGAVGARPKPKTLGGGKPSGAGGKQKSSSAAGGAATGVTGSKKRKTADTAPAPLPAAKKPKPAPAKTAGGRVTRSTAEPPAAKAPRKLRPGRQIGYFFYFEYADNLPKGYSWDDDYEREWRESPDSDDDEHEDREDRD